MTGLEVLVRDAEVGAATPPSDIAVVDLAATPARMVRS